MAVVPAPLKGHSTDASVHLDAIRGLAALIVFLSHGRGLFLKTGLHYALVGAYALRNGTRQGSAANALPVSPSIGHLAVIVFSVLSGYFVGGSVLRSVRKDRFSWKKYLFLRLTRLWVVLIPALLLAWALDFGGLHLLHSAQNIYAGHTGSDVAPGLPGRETPGVFFGNLFFVQMILTQPFGTNLPLWSLSYEFWFYIFFPLLVTLFVASKRVKVRIIAATLLLILAGFCGAEISEYFLIWLLGLGIELLPLPIPSRLRRLSILSSALLVFLTMYLELKFPIDLFLSDLILGIVFSLFMWTVLHQQAATTRRLYRNSAQGLSRMSYTLYTVHMPMFVLICAVLMPVWQPWPISPQSLAKLSAIYLLVFAASWVLYYCFERNTDWIRHRLESLLHLRTRVTHPNQKIVAE